MPAAAVIRKVRALYGYIRYKEGRQLESVKFRKIINIIFTMKSLILAQDER